LLDAVELGRPPSDLCFLFAQLAPDVSHKHELQSEFWPYFFDSEDADDSATTKIQQLMHLDHHPTSQALIVPDLESALASFTDEQHHVAAQIIDSVLGTTD
jgi:hypothetical protein